MHSASGQLKWDTVGRPLEKQAIMSVADPALCLKRGLNKASPYLLDLGLSKSLMSLVFVAGPLSGLVMQPIIGVLADRSRSRFGRRRPFMLAGCVVSVFAMMLLSWAREVAEWCGGGRKLAIGLAVWAIYLIDFVSLSFETLGRRSMLMILVRTVDQRRTSY
jgi:MFS family permease